MFTLSESSDWGLPPSHVTPPNLSLSLSLFLSLSLSRSQSFDFEARNAVQQEQLTCNDVCVRAIYPHRPRVAGKMTGLCA